jgi:membrane fusion protein, copper/silver efflux system
MNKTQRIGISLLVVILAAIGVGTGWYFLKSKRDNVMTGSSDIEALSIYRSGPFHIGVRVTPEIPVVGDNKFRLQLQDNEGKPVAGAEINAFGQMAAMGTMSAMRAPTDMEEMSPGLYEGTFNLSMSGAWPLTVLVEKPGMGSTRLSFDMATGQEGLELTSGGSAITPAEESVMMDKQTATQDVNGVIHSGNYKIVARLDTETVKMGVNRLLIQIADRNNTAITGAHLRAVAQFQHPVGTQSNNGKSEDSQQETVTIMAEEISPGQYAATVELTRAGQWALALDIEKEGHGHADIIFDISTGHAGLKLATTTPEGIAYYTCSMHTSVRAAGPGQCPICSMDLVSVMNEEVQTGAITIDNRRRQSIGLKTGTTTQRNLSMRIRAVGEVVYDETRLADVSLRFDSWIGELKADYVGKAVKKGEVLFTVYSPELLAAQQEYLEVFTRRQEKPGGFIVAARKRLLLWDLVPQQIKQLEQRREPLDYVPILASHSGTVIKKNIVTGSANKAGMTLMRIADLSRVWVEAEVYESELELVRLGMEAVVTLPYLPGQTFNAKVDYIYPYLADATRTGRMRLLLDNYDGHLKPNMYAEVKLKVDLGQRLVVPEEAVMFAGDSRVVFVDLGDGKLKPQKIITGVQTRDYIEVLEGLWQGDRVVISGNFLVAAESRIKSGTAQW